MFKGRKIIIATKHQKEKVIAPILEKELGVICVTTTNLNTDLFGTFTGEIKRENDPVTAAREKCLLAMKLYNCDLAIANEGSFGPHPSTFFIPADDEIVLLIDKRNNLEILERELSTDTNFNGQEIKSFKELMEFADRVKFPSHGIIIRKAKDDNTEIVKGINRFNDLKDTFDRFQLNYGSVFAETDMRAMFNPSRMKVIESATRKLVKKIFSTCPKCGTPGFGVTEVKQGLPCSLCGLPTNSTLAYIYTCLKCGYEKKEMYPNNKTTEDPTYCNFCNP